MNFIQLLAKDLTAALGLVALGLTLLACGLPGVGVWLVLYGGGNRIYSIARGTVPLALFGPVRYPLVVCRLARPGLVAQALAPPAGAFILTHATPQHPMVAAAIPEPCQPWPRRGDVACAVG